MFIAHDWGKVRIMAMDSALNKGVDHISTGMERLEAATSCGEKTSLQGAVMMVPFWLVMFRISHHFRRFDVSLGFLGSAL